MWSCPMLTSKDYISKVERRWCTREFTMLIMVAWEWVRELLKRVMIPSSSEGLLTTVKLSYPIIPSGINPSLELGPHKDREKLLPGWELNKRPSGLIIAAPPTELQGQTGAGRGKWRCNPPLYLHIHCRDINIFISHNPLPSDLVAQSVEQRWSNPKVVDSIPTLVRVFLCPCVGPFSICRANAHMVYGLKHHHFTIHSIIPFVLQYMQRD